MVINRAFYEREYTASAVTAALRCLQPGRACGTAVDLCPSRAGRNYYAIKGHLVLSAMYCSYDLATIMKRTMYIMIVYPPSCRYPAIASASTALSKHYVQRLNEIKMHKY